jgi:serine/threonine protein kinase
MTDLAEDTPMDDDVSTDSGFEPGRVVAERYEILEAIGSGTSGVVYRARDLYVDGEHEIVALKAIHAHLHNDRQMAGRFRREVRILGKLEGPHLCKLLECIEEDGLLMIAIEFVDGPPLDEYLREHPNLPLSEVVAIMAQLCIALQSAHDAGVIHRDLKPSNVLIEGAWNNRGDDSEPPKSFLRNLGVRVVDFGLAKLVQGDTTGTVLTEQDMVFGTPDYMAPEQVAGDELDTRCDIYAAGVMLFEMVTGVVPYDTPGPLTTMTAHVNAPIPTPSDTASDRDIPKSLDRCIVKTLAKLPADRYATAADLAHALTHLDDDEPADTSDVGGASDTQLEHAQTAMGTTLQSHKDEALGDGSTGDEVRVVVRSAPPASLPSDSRRDMEPISSIGPVAEERQFWTVAAILMMVAAVAAGIWLGMN